MLFERASGTPVVMGLVTVIVIVAISEPCAPRHLKGVFVGSAVALQKPEMAMFHKKTPNTPFPPELIYALMLAPRLALTDNQPFM